MNFAEKYVPVQPLSALSSTPVSSVFSAFVGAPKETISNAFGVEFTRFSLPIAATGLSEDALDAVLKRCGGVGIDVDANTQKANQLSIPETMPKAQLYWEKSGDMLHFTLRGKHATFPAKALSEDARRIEEQRAEGAKAMGR